MITDPATVVRAAACRCCGIFVVFPSLKEDLLWLNDVAGLLVKIVPDSGSAVRTRATWALANWCDTIVELSTITNNATGENA